MYCLARFRARLIDGYHDFSLLHHIPADCEAQHERRRRVDGFLGDVPALRKNPCQCQQGFVSCLRHIARNMPTSIVSGFSPSGRNTLRV